MLLQLFLSPSDIRNRGLAYLRIRSEGRSVAAQNADFHDHYGSSPLDLAEMWFDLNATDIPGAKLTGNEKSEKGLKQFFVTHHFLWAYPKNSKILAKALEHPERYCRGEPLWKWVGKIAAMKAKKIVWEPRLDDPNSEKFIITVDGTDFKVREKKHPTLPVDTLQCSKKFNHGALKYEIALSVFRPKCVWISGPHRGGKHDLTIFREGLKAKMPPGKLVIADRGYNTSNADEKMLSQPNDLDSKELNNFKSRARLRQETYNGRLTFFNILNATFKQSDAKHKLALEAVCVIVQYQMDNGSEIFAV